jgi:hypothetical protein
MDNYCKELEDLIAEVLLPAYIEHCRLLGRENPTREINQKLISAMKQKKKVPAILIKEKYGS